MNGYDAERATALPPRVLEDAARRCRASSAVALASRLPLAPDINMEGVRVPGHHQPEDDGTPVDAVSSGADYFAAVGVPLVEGRTFTEDETWPASARSLIVNETFARTLLAGPAARSASACTLGGLDQAPLEIVGVARDHKVRSVGEAPRPYLHLPATPVARIALVVRTAQPGASGAAGAARGGAGARAGRRLHGGRARGRGRGHHARADAHRRRADRRVRRAGAAAGGGRPLRRRSRTR